MPHGGLIQLQETLLHKYLGKKLKIHSADEGIGVIKERLRHKKIILVLDDVDQLEQLENLAGVGWFGEGSRVIITTKDSGLLNSHGIESIYHVQELNDDQALELFSLNAFGRSEPPKDFSELAQRAIAYAQGLPVALTLLGSHLCNKRIHRWQVILDDYEGEPYTGIQKVLRKSYDALENSVQQVFLDIACFFKGEHKNYVLQIVSSSKNKVTQDCIEVLVEKAMITIECNKILIHDLLEKLGKDIVREESPNDPGKRSRLWFHEDVKQVLMENTGTRKIKGIMVKLPEPDEIPLNEKSFVGMVNLEIFINRNAFLSGHIEYLPNELRLIDWGRCQLQFLPSNFRAKHLVVFNMPCSDIRILERFKNLPKLTSMNLRGCQFLKKIPDLSGLPNLKCLNLSECTSLVEVDGSVGFLDKLVELDLGGCFELTRFATRLGLKSLRRFVLIDCKRLESFPEIEVKMESLWNLYMEGSGIRELPSSIANLTELRKLSADYCENLTITSLRSIYGLQRLTELSLNGCPKLLSFRDKVNSEVSSSNTKLHLLSTNSNISLALPNLFEFDVKGCNLSESDFLLPLDCWSTLTYLDLSGNNFVRLSGCINKFINLRHLYLHDCRSLLEIPDEVLPPRVACIVLDNCTSLEKIPKLPPAVEHLSLINCIRLRGYDIGENIFLNQVYSEFEIHLPGDEVLKWFSCCKDAALVEHYPNPDGEEEYDAGCELS
ncbi:TMV resistance protein N-like [Prunus avium]|uniref:TMV resistance protein N-like n=1 Tax=Prunus avium TaxID=42229 RepID=A0A6P5T0T4_PRUAV|nr:TMV resistance protein N-like [Prunus avium]